MHKNRPSGSIDIGTNSILLLIARREAGKLVPITDEARIARLGQGLHEKQAFCSEAMERTLAILQEYKFHCDQAGCRRILAVGTAAFRLTRNAAEFCERVRRETGIEIRVISGNEEARLSFLSVKNDFGDRPGLLALDIGGGSTELIDENGGQSFELGTVVLSERHFRHDPPTNGEITEVIGIIEERLNGLTLQPRGELSPPRPVHAGRGGTAPTLVGLAGTVTTLSSVNQRLATWQPNKIQGSSIMAHELDKMIALFRSTETSALKKIPGMVPGREDTILAGSLVLRKVMEFVGVESVLVSDRGLRYGLLLSSPQSSGAPPERP